jgi:hypothetical protein
MRAWRRIAIVAGLVLVAAGIAALEYFAISFAGTFARSSVASGIGQVLSLVLGVTMMVMAGIGGVVGLLLIVGVVRERFW